MSQNHFTLQLNTEALEKLFADAGPDFVLKIKQSAIQEFLKRRVKALVPEETEKITNGMIQEEIRKEIGSVSTWPEFRVKLNPKFEATVNNQIKELIALELGKYTENITKAVDERLELRTKELKNYYSNEVDRKITRATEKYITDEVDRRLEAILNKIKGTI